MPQLTCIDLGLLSYRKALTLQAELAQERISGSAGDYLLLLEHPPVYTRGRRSEAAELPYGEEWYLERGIEIYESDRGGRVTYHGPGQLVAYPIVSLKRVGDNVHSYIRLLEETVVNVLASYGIEAGAREGLTGVWVEQRKIASIGIHVSRGVTTHGFAINAVNELEPFSWIVPCGLERCQVTSIKAELGREPDLDQVRERTAQEFAALFGARLNWLTRSSKVEA